MKISEVTPINHFFTNGFVQYQIEDNEMLNSFEHLNFINVEYDSNDDSYNNRAPSTPDPNLVKFSQKIFDALIKPNFTKSHILEVACWDGVDSGSLNWHNDCQSPKSLNSNILIYLDHLNNPNEGALHIRNTDQKFRIWPIKGTVVWLNQTHLYQHKADRTSDRRRVIGIDLYIPEISFMTSFSTDLV